MLKSFLGIYINPDAVGWVKRDQKVENDIRTDTISVFSRNGEMIYQTSQKPIDKTSHAELNKRIDDALAALGLESDE